MDSANDAFFKVLGKYVEVLNVYFLEIDLIDVLSPVFDQLLDVVIVTETVEDERINLFLVKYLALIPFVAVVYFLLALLHFNLRKPFHYELVQYFLVCLGARVEQRQLELCLKLLGCRIWWQWAFLDDIKTLPCAFDVGCYVSFAFRHLYFLQFVQVTPPAEVNNAFGGLEEVIDFACSQGYNVGLLVNPISFLFNLLQQFTLTDQIPFKCFVFDLEALSFSKLLQPVFHAVQIYL